MYFLKSATFIAKVSFRRCKLSPSLYIRSDTNDLIKPICSRVSVKFCSTLTQDSKTIKDENVVVYVGPLTKQIRNVKMFSFISSMAGLFSQPYIYTRAIELNMGTGLLITLCSIMGIFTFITPLLLHYVTKKYVLYLEHQPTSNTYTAVTYSLFLRYNRLNFQPGDAYVPLTPAMFTSVSIKGSPLLLDPKFFDDIEHYKKIMGYDKPMDFKLGPSK